MEHGYKKLSRELMYQGKVIAFFKEHMHLPNGVETDWDYIAHPGGAGVLPVLDNGNVILIKQYRNSMDKICIEIPAGKRDSADESFLTCATRELEEETGYKSDNVVLLSETIPAIGYSNELLGIFYADHLQKTEQHLDEDEEINLFEIPLEKAVSMCLNGEIIDSKTVTAIMLYNYKVEHDGL